MCNKSQGFYGLNSTLSPAAQPEPQRPSDEELLEAFDQAVAAFPPVHSEAESLSAVEYARELEIRKARAVLARIEGER
jgi:hypothetical protein